MSLCGEFSESVLFLYESARQSRTIKTRLRIDYDSTKTVDSTSSRNSATVLVSACRVRISRVIISFVVGPSLVLNAVELRF